MKRTPVLFEVKSTPSVSKIKTEFTRQYTNSFGGEAFEASVNKIINYLKKKFVEYDRKKFK